MAADVAVPAGTAAPSGRRSAGERLDGALVAAVVLGAGLRLWGLGAQSLWYDEWLTAEAVSGGLGDLVRHVAHREGIPPTPFAPLWAWVRVAGEGEAALRALSALAGVATIPVAYAAAGALRQPRRVARAAALLVAVNPLLVWYGQEARPYSLLALLGALSLLTLARFWHSGRSGDLAAWAVVAAGAVAVHYVAVFLVAAEGLALVAARRWPWRRLAPAALPTLVVLAALAPVALRQHSHTENRRWITDFPLAARLTEAGQSALVGPSPPDGRLWMAAAAVLAGAVALAAVRPGADWRAAAAVAGVALAAVVLASGAALAGLDVLVGRYLVASLVPLVVAAAVALGAPPAPRWAGAAGVTAVVVLAALSLVAVVAVARDPYLQRPDWRAVAGAHRAGGPDGPRMLVVNAHGVLASPLRRYLPEARPLRAGEAVTVERIDVVAVDRRGGPCNLLVGHACGLVFLGAPLPPTVAARLTPGRPVRLSQFTLERHRAPRPVTVTSADVLAPGDRGWALILVTGDVAGDDEPNPVHRSFRGAG